MLFSCKIENDDRFSFLSLNQNTLTMILYKYYPCNEYTYRSISELGLWLGRITDMNDPFDCLRQLNINYELSLQDFLQKKTFEFSENMLTHMFANVRRMAIENFTFCSLTEDPFNILMWSHYANSHQGIVLGIELNENDISTSLVEKVEYKNNLPLVDIEYLKRIFSVINIFSLPNSEWKQFYQYLSLKTLDWSYEKEWRIWGGKTPKYLNYINTDIKSIYFGLRCPEETKTLVKSILRGHCVSDDVYHDIKIETDPEIRLII